MSYFLEPKISTSVSLNLVQEWFGLETLRYPPRKMKVHSAQTSISFCLLSVQAIGTDCDQQDRVERVGLRLGELDICPWQGPVDSFLKKQPNYIDPNYILCPVLCQVGEGPLDWPMGWRWGSSPKEEQSAITQSGENRCRPGHRCPLAWVF